jgi:hypothetical protein
MISNSNNIKKRIGSYAMAIILSLMIPILFVSFSFTFHSEGDESQELININGIVYSSSGIPLDNISITFFPDHAFMDKSEGKMVHSLVNGVFHVEIKEGDSWVLEVNGEDGAGRYLLSADSIDRMIRLTYPVTETIVFLHTNDRHFDMNLQNEFAAIIDSIRNKYSDVFLLDAGDVFTRHPLRWTVNGGSGRGPEWYGARAFSMISAMNESGYDAMTLGNHELAYIDNYTRIALDAADFPILAANIEITTEHLPEVKSHILLQTKTGRKIAILGISTDNAKKQGVKERNQFIAAREHMYLRDSSDVFVALTHIGLRRDTVLAGRAPYLDVIIGGHTHDLLEEAIVVNGVLVAHAGGNPHVVSDDHPVTLGKVIVELVNGTVLNKSGRVMTLQKNQK